MVPRKIVPSLREAIGRLLFKENGDIRLTALDTTIAELTKVIQNQQKALSSLVKLRNAIKYAVIRSGTTSAAGLVRYLESLPKRTCTSCMKPRPHLQFGPVADYVYCTECMAADAPDNGRYDPSVPTTLDDYPDVAPSVTRFTTEDAFLLTSRDPNSN